MSLSDSTIQAIQQAGQSLNAARQAVAFDVQANASKVVSLVASQPFSPENDAAYKKLRSAARMAHDLQTMEDQLSAIYTAASEIGEAQTPKMIALPVHVPASSVHRASGKADAEDVIAKPPTQRKTKTPSVEQTKNTKPIIGNALKVLTYLKTVLDRRSWKPVTYATVAQEAGIPLGSIGISLKRLIEANVLVEGKNKGTFRLA